jgi:hypothetical protein
MVAQVCVPVHGGPLPHAHAPFVQALLLLPQLLPHAPQWAVLDCTAMHSPAQQASALAQA